MPTFQLSISLSRTHYYLPTILLVSIFLTFFPTPTEAATRAELEAQIAYLQERIAAMRGQSSVSSCGSSWTRNLTIGDRGTDVSRLQEYLRSTGDFTYPEITDFFGPTTAGAVARFQERYREAILVPAGLLSGSGYFGSGTQAQIRILCAIVSPSAETRVDTKETDDSEERQVRESLDASPASGTTPLRVKFTASINRELVGEIKFDFGDGSTATVSKQSKARSETIYHTYTNPGNYNSRLMRGNTTLDTERVVVTAEQEVTVDPTEPADLTQVLVSSFKNQSDIAVELQAAINNPETETIIFDGSRSTTYTSSAFKLRSDLKIKFENGVVLRAKPQAFTTDDIFIRGDYVKNVMIEGGSGSRIEMNKSEYNRLVHALAFYNADKVTVRNLEISDSGGDGIYLGDNSGGKGYNKDILIDSVTLDNHARNALSVISVDGLIIKNSTFSNTKPDKSALDGPWDGIDFEPNFSSQILQDIEVRDSVFYGNVGEAIDLHFTKLIDPNNNTISIRMINNRIYDSEWGIKLLFIQSIPFKGEVVVEGLCSDRPTMSRAVYGPTYAPVGTFTTSDIRLNCSSF